MAGSRTSNLEGGGVADRVFWLEVKGPAICVLDLRNRRGIKPPRPVGQFVQVLPNDTCMQTLARIEWQRTEYLKLDFFLKG